MDKGFEQFSKEDIQMSSKHMERCSTSLIFREMQIETTGRYFTSITMVIIKKSTNDKGWRECREKGTPYSVGRNVNWCSHYGRQYGDSL